MPLKQDDGDLAKKSSQTKVEVRQITREQQREEDLREIELRSSFLAAQAKLF
jgi:hypothetical protein